MHDSDSHRRSVAISGAGKISWAVATLITAAITARYLGPTGRGVLVAAVAWVTLFSVFGHLSLSQVVVFLASGKRQAEWLPAAVGGLGIVLLSVTLIGGLASAVLYASTSGAAFNNIPATTLAIALCAFPLLMAIEHGNGVLMSLGKLEFLSAVQILNGAATVLLTFLAVGPLGLGIDGAVLALVLSSGVTVAVTAGYLIKQAGRVAIDWSFTRQLLAGGAKLHLNAVGAYLFSQANILILNHYRTPDETAWFHLALQLVTAIQVIPMAVATVTYSLVSRHGPDAAWPHQRKLLFEVLAVVCVFAVGGYLLAPMLLPRVFGSAFAPAVPVFRLLLLAVVGMTLSTVMASQWIARGLFIQAAGLTLLLGALTVVGNCLVVPRNGMIGAAWVTNSVYFVAIVGNGAMALWVNARWRRLSLVHV